MCNRSSGTKLRYVIELPHSKLVPWKLHRNFRKREYSALRMASLASHKYQSADICPHLCILDEQIK